MNGNIAHIEGFSQSRSSTFTTLSAKNSPDYELQVQTPFGTISIFLLKNSISWRRGQ